MSNSLDPDQARHFVGSDLGPNCLGRFSADYTSRQSFSFTLMHAAYVSYWATGLQCICSVGRALDWGSKGGWFEPHGKQSHCHVSLRKTLYALLSTGSTQDVPSRHG